MESDVHTFVHYPKGNPEWDKIIGEIRKRGNFLHNTYPTFNNCILIPCRQRQSKYNSVADDYTFVVIIEGDFFQNEPCDFITC